MLVGDEFTTTLYFFYALQSSSIIFSQRHTQITDQAKHKSFELAGIVLTIYMRTTQGFIVPPSYLLSQWSKFHLLSSYIIVNVLDVNFQVVPLILILHEKLLSL